MNLADYVFNKCINPREDFSYDFDLNIKNNVDFVVQNRKFNYSTLIETCRNPVNILLVADKKKTDKEYKALLEKSESQTTPENINPPLRALNEFLIDFLQYLAVNIFGDFSIIPQDYSEFRETQYYYEGMMGLNEASSEFDENNGTSFKHFSEIYIRRFYIELQKENISNERMLLSKNDEKILKQINGIKDDYFKETGEEASDDEIAKRTGESLETIREIQSYSNMYYASYIEDPTDDDIEPSTYISSPYDKKHDITNDPIYNDNFMNCDEVNDEDDSSGRFVSKLKEADKENKLDELDFLIIEAILDKYDPNLSSENKTSGLNGVFLDDIAKEVGKSTKTIKRRIEPWKTEAWFRELIQKIVKMSEKN